MGVEPRIFGKGCLFATPFEARLLFALESGGGFPFVIGEMIYSLSLRDVGIALGLLLIIAHGLALLHAQGAKQLLRVFPRSRFIGMVLLTIDAVWAYLLVSKMDLGEFSSWRETIKLVIVGGYFLTAVFVTEFLAVRALGILALLAAEPLIESAFLRPETSRLLVTIIGYAWAALGLFWVGMPYLLRDQINWISSNAPRWKFAAFGGLAYGAVVLFFALTQY